MKACCDARLSAKPERLRRFVAWLLPSTVIALMPKCPACLAAYIALGSGISLSLPFAEVLRAAALWVSVGALGVLGLRFVARASRRHGSRPFARH